MTKILIQTQLSNYNSQGKFILEADSGWQMCAGRIREMLKLLPGVEIHVMGPEEDQVITSPFELSRDLFDSGRVFYVGHHILPNALATRYDFNFDVLALRLNLEAHKVDCSLRYDFVYLNDPMHLRAFRALFYLKAGYMPKFVVHSHFVDVPEVPKFPVEASLWLGQCEAAVRADYNFWQCETAMSQFFDSMGRTFLSSVVQDVVDKSDPWDDGYSITEITAPVDYRNVRFSVDEFERLTKNKTILFVPNRIGGRGRSSDYTACGKFMFEVLPELRRVRNDYVVIAGNPSQKFSNEELEYECGSNGYINLVPDSLNRDEFKFIVSRSDISVGLYREDTYGGTASRECIELGSLPLWLDIYEYSKIVAEAGDYQYLCRTDFSDIVEKLSGLIDYCREGDRLNWSQRFQKVVRDRCSYEFTTPRALTKLGLIK